MRRILVTGMSGTGKSAALEELRKRGFQVVNTDYGGWTEWNDEDGATSGARTESRVRHGVEPGPLLSAVRRGRAPERTG